MTMRPVAVKKLNQSNLRVWIQPSLTQSEIFCHCRCRNGSLHQAMLYYVLYAYPRSHSFCLRFELRQVYFSGEFFKYLDSSSWMIKISFEWIKLVSTKSRMTYCSAFQQCAATSSQTTFLLMTAELLMLSVVGYRCSEKTNEGWKNQCLNFLKALLDLGLPANVI